MKIEKVNENQIRCTLTREDLASRELKISELAYGTEKAKNLFRDMMQQANFEFGFEAEDIPLMIEAIPLNSECIVLIITKVEDPEELDTRFARFAPSVTDDEDASYDNSAYEDPADDVMDLFRRLKNPQSEASADGTVSSENGEERSFVFSMETMQQVMSAASIVGRRFEGLSSLYKDEINGRYLLLLSQNGSPDEMFERVCNTLSEYGTIHRPPSAGNTFLAEHLEALISENALALLSGG
ncbi:MAG: adaptor protein MecA [Lachnospiraceae bacterium]|nr:adaptor protein MecA [Lachnospiraceae bacterium]